MIFSRGNAASTAIAGANSELVVYSSSVILSDYVGGEKVAIATVPSNYSKFVMVNALFSVTTSSAIILAPSIGRYYFGDKTLNSYGLYFELLYSGTQLNTLDTVYASFREGPSVPSGNVVGFAVSTPSVGYTILRGSIKVYGFLIP